MFQIIIALVRPQCLFNSAGIKEPPIASPTPGSPWTARTLHGLAGPIWAYSVWAYPVWACPVWIGSVWACAVWVGVVSGILLLASPSPGWAEPLVLKQGSLQTLPLLQTRAQSPFSFSEHFYLGMLEERFLAYAIDNNWQTISTQSDQWWVRWQLLPGGEAIYTTGSALPIYARGFIVQAYFERGRLVGLNLIRDPEEPGFTIDHLSLLIRGWFPDNRILMRYQVLPEDPSAQVISAYLGVIPPGFIGDIARNQIPFCPALLTPNASVPLAVPSLELPPQCADDLTSPTMLSDTMSN